LRATEPTGAFQSFSVLDERSNSPSQKWNIAMYSKYRNSVLTASIALALASASGAALAGPPCEDDPSHKANKSSHTNMPGQTNMPSQANKSGQAYQSRQANMQDQDISSARQESQIQTTYSLNSNLRENDLQVSVKDGKATLTGTVEEDVSKELANTIALNVAGINSVDNQIKVDPNYAPAARISQERSFGEVVEDAAVTAAVKSKLLWSSNTDGMGMDVDTKKGKVTLTGSAKSDAAKAFAQTTAENTRGVVSVDNRLVVDSSSDSNLANNDFGQETYTTVSDGWITTKVNSTLIYSTNVESRHIEVSTDQGVVTLSGTVDTNDDRDHAIELAENIRGVKSVNAAELTLSNRSNLSSTGLTQNVSNSDSE